MEQEHLLQVVIMHLVMEHHQFFQQLQVQVEEVEEVLELVFQQVNQVDQVEVVDHHNQHLIQDNQVEQEIVHQ